MIFLVAKTFLITFMTDEKNLNTCLKNIIYNTIYILKKIFSICKLYFYLKLKTVQNKLLNRGVRFVYSS
jgi:hypothetical protein